MIENQDNPFRFMEMKKHQSLTASVLFAGRSVIIGFQKTQIYQRFAGSRQEVFILKI